MVRLDLTEKLTLLQFVRGNTASKLPASTLANLSSPPAERPHLLTAFHCQHFPPPDGQTRGTATLVSLDLNSPAGVFSSILRIEVLQYARPNPWGNDSKGLKSSLKVNTPVLPSPSRYAQASQGQILPPALLFPTFPPRGQLL